MLNLTGRYLQGSQNVLKKASVAVEAGSCD